MKPRFSFVPFRFVLSMAAVAAALSWVAADVAATPGGRPPSVAEQQAGEQQAPAGEQQAGAQQVAQRPGYEETIVVTAERDPADIRDVGSSVSVISGEEIRASGARWLLDVLQLAPGVSVARGGPPGSLTEAFIRGADNNHTLVLIDGIKVNSPTSGAYDLAGLQISTDQIERIEIVKGPQSTLYGSQAIGGVINVITRQGSGAGTWGVEVDGGSYDTGGLRTWGHGQAGSLRYAGNLAFLDSGGFSAASEDAGNPEADGYRNLTYDGRVDWTSDVGVVARAFFRGFDGDLEFDGYDFVSGPVDHAGNAQSARDIYAGGAVGYDGGRYSSIVEVSTSEAELETETPGDFFLGFGLDSSIREVDWQSQLELAAGHTLMGGVEYRRERAEVESRTALGADGFSESVDVIGVYVQDRMSVGDRAHLGAGLRYEEHTTFGGKWTGRVTASVDLGERARAHGSAGTGFMAPTLNDLYFPGFSNPDLQPEESLGLDAGVEIFLPEHRLVGDATVFYNDIDQLIAFDFVAGIPANIGNVIAAGLELSAEWLASDTLRLAGSYTYTNAHPAGDDQQLVRRPRHQGSVRATVQATPRLLAWGELRVKSERFDGGPSGLVALPAYGLINLAGEYRLHDAVALRGRIDNLFDADYEEVVGFGTAGVSGYVGLAVTLTRR
ncbi:MAG TPA: TonB-dependent receptor [Acidobacteriota bacterium]